MSIPNANSVLDRIRARQKAAADNEAINMKDPNEKGVVSPPNHPDGDSDSKKMVPPSATNKDNQEGTDLTDKDTNPSGTGKNVPGPVSDGDAKDERATSPTTSIDKIAGDVSNVLERIKALRQGSDKSAQENKPTTAPVAPKTAGSNEADDIANQIELTPEFHMKLATLILETEEGIQFAERLLRKAAGEEKAAEIIKSAMEQQQAYIQYSDAYEEQVKMAQYQEYQQALQVEEMLKSASDEDIRGIEKRAAVHGAQLSTLRTDFEKKAYMDGAADAAGMADAEAAGGAPVIPGAEEGPMGVEEILALLEEMVASGEISEEEAMQVAESLMAEEGGMGGEMGGEEMPLPEEAPEEAKMANVLLKQAKARNNR